MRRAVLFDFDGTLIDTWRLYLEAFRRSLAPHFGRGLSDEEILALKPTAERRLLQRIVEEARFSDLFAGFLTEYHVLHDSHCDGLYPGVPALLDALRDKGYALGVVTGKSRAAWDKTFPACGLGPFDVVVTDDDVTHPKPHPEGLFAALEAMAVAPARALYVGDSLLDCEAARAAGIPFGAALWSKRDDERQTFIQAVRAGGENHWFDEPGDILDHLDADREASSA
ncbi:HAD family hydrolase [Candidatus Nitrospira bockiana]